MLADHTSLSASLPASEPVATAPAANTTAAVEEVVTVTTAEAVLPATVAVVAAAEAAAPAPEAVAPAPEAVAIAVAKRPADAPSASVGPATPRKRPAKTKG